jgi:hypothetical protein
MDALGTYAAPPTVPSVRLPDQAGENARKNLFLDYKFLPSFTVKLGERFRGGTVYKTEEIIEGLYVYQTWRTIRRNIGFDIYAGYFCAPSPGRRGLDGAQ